MACAPQVMEEFGNIFGSDLKAVTGDIDQIEEVLCRVDSLRLPFEDIVFNPFDFYKISSWKIIMQDFYASVEVSGSFEPKKFLILNITRVCKTSVSSQHIEEEAIGIIDHCFKTLRSSTTALDLLLKFKHIHTREAINSHLMRKFNDILVQFCKEVQSWTIGILQLSFNKEQSICVHALRSCQDCSVSITQVFI